MQTVVVVVVVAVVVVAAAAVVVASVVGRSLSCGRWQGTACTLASSAASSPTSWQPLNEMKLDCSALVLECSAAYEMFSCSWNCSVACCTFQNVCDCRNVLRPFRSCRLTF